MDPRRRKVARTLTMEGMSGIIANNCGQTGDVVIGEILRVVTVDAARRRCWSSGDLVLETQLGLSRLR